MQVVYDNDVHYKGGPYDQYMDEPQYFNPLNDAVVPAVNEYDSEDEYSNEDVEEHMNSDDEVDRKNVVTLVMEIKKSMAFLAANPSECVFRLPESALKHLKHVEATHNRTNASDADRNGDLKRGIILKATITAAKNEFPMNIGLDLPGLVPSELTAHSRHNFVLMANLPAHEGLSIDISTPDSIFTKWMYENWKVCTPEDLDAEIIDSRKDPTQCHLYPDSMIWQAITTLCKRGFFKSQADTIHEINQATKHFSDERTQAMVTAPKNIVYKVRDKLVEPMLLTEQAFVNMEKFDGRFTRADGKKWNSHTALVSNTINTASDESTYDANEMTIVRHALAKVRIEFVTQREIKESTQ